MAARAYEAAVRLESIKNHIARLLCSVRETFSFSPYLVQLVGCFHLHRSLHTYVYSDTSDNRLINKSWYSPGTIHKPK